mgnify:CR=1 FL=1
MAADSNSDNPLDQLRLSLMQDVLPVAVTHPFIDHGSRIGSAGSCFAIEIAQNLMSRGFNYICQETTYDAETETIVMGTSPEDPVVQYSCRWGILFNTPSFTQIVENAFGVRPLPPLLVRYELGNEIVYLDPYRENVMFKSPDAYMVEREKHAANTRAVFENADVFVMTLGLNEAWQYLPDGTYISRNPRNKNLNGLLTHRTLSVEENIDYLQRFVDVVRAHNPNIKLVVTVSPVPFLATGRADEYHVITANGHSKAVLRVAAQEIVERILVARMKGGQAAQRGDLVGRVVIDMGAGIGGEMIRHPVQRILESHSFRLMIVTPPMAEDGTAAVTVMHAPKVIETALLQRIAFQIEEQVGGIGFRQVGKAASGLGRQGFDYRIPARHPRDLEAGLAAQLGEGGGRHARHANVLGRGCERCGGRYTGGLQSLCLRQGQPSDAREAVFGHPDPFAVIQPRAERTRAARIGRRASSAAGNEGQIARNRSIQHVTELRHAKACPIARAELDVHP